jgi:predicted transcriptional regulator
MRVATGTVISGKVVLDGPVIADGTDVYVLTRDASDAAVLSDDELAELEAGLAEADRGDMIAGDAFLADLRRHG